MPFSDFLSDSDIFWSGYVKSIVYKPLRKRVRGTGWHIDIWFVNDSHFILRLHNHIYTEYYQFECRNNDLELIKKRVNDKLTELNID
jgi:hypothetical protein